MLTLSCFALCCNRAFDNAGRAGLADFPSPETCKSALYPETLLSVLSKRAVPHQASHVYLTTVRFHTCQYKQTVLNIWRKHPALRSINKIVILVLTPKLIPYSNYGACWGKEEEKPRPETPNIHSLLPPCSPGKPGAHVWLSLCLGEEVVCSPAALWVRLWWARQVWHPVTADMAMCLACCRWMWKWRYAHDLPELPWNVCFVSSSNLRLPVGLQEVWAAFELKAIVTRW